MERAQPANNRHPLLREGGWGDEGHTASAGPPQGGTANTWSGRSPRTTVTPFFEKGAGGWGSQSGDFRHDPLLWLRLRRCQLAAAETGQRLVIFQW